MKIFVAIAIHSIGLSISIFGSSLSSILIVLCISTANSTQLPSAGSSLGAEKKKKTPVLSEEVPVERIALLASDGFQSKGNQNSGASSSSQNDNVIQKLSSDVGQNNVNVTKSCLPDEYKPEKWMLADLESGALSQLNLAIVGHHPTYFVNTVSIIWHCSSTCPIL